MKKYEQEEVEMHFKSIKKTKRAKYYEKKKEVISLRNAKYYEKKKVEIMTPVTVLKEEFNPNWVTDGSSEISSDTAATEFVDVDQSLLTENEIKKEDIITNNEPRTSSGWKIAGFALDPGTSAFVSTPMVTQSSRVTENKESIELTAQALAEQIKFRLSKLSFIHASRQYEKMYQ